MLRKSLTLTLLCIAFMACKNDPKTEATQVTPKADTPTKAPVSPDGSTTFIITEGTVTWTSKYSIGKNGHQGTISAERGEILVNQGQILFGNVTLNMNSISVTDIKASDKRQELESHLKDSDFFETDKFPKAEFGFSSVSPGTMPGFNWVLNGDLTMKGKTAPVNIPVKVSIVGEVLHAESPSFPINRTNWGVNFKSGLLGAAKDEMIDDMVAISLKVVAKKK